MTRTFRLPSDNLANKEEYQYWTVLLLGLGVVCEGIKESRIFDLVSVNVVDMWRYIITFVCDATPSLLFVILKPLLLLVTLYHHVCLWCNFIAVIAFTVDPFHNLMNCIDALVFYSVLCGPLSLYHNFIFLYFGGTPFIRYSEFDFCF